MFPVPAALIALALSQAAPAPAAGPGLPPERLEGAEQLRRTDIPVALVLSGGVSLGSYEAGLSWAVVRFSRGASSRPVARGRGAPRLVAVTGASAGSINALLSGILWCAEAAPDEDAIDHNLLRDLWLSVGFDGLLPDDPGGYLPGDALLSTRPLLDGFTGFERRLGAATARRGFRPGCRIPIGLTVTRARAAEHEVGGLTVRTQRFALPWRLEVGADGVARMVSQRLAAPESRSDVLDIARRAELGPTLAWPQVMQGILASAAFPIAFRPRELCNCSPRCPVSNQVRSGTCDGPLGPMTHLSCPARSPEGEPLTLCSHQYVDGGIFDNTPVGLSVDLTQSLSATQPLQPLTYVYIDPDVRRLRPTAPEESVPPPASTPTRALGQNLEEVARLAAELVATARTEDLSRTLRSGPWNATTRRLLYETAGSLLSFATVAQDAAATLGRSGAAPDGPGRDLAPSSAARGATARALLRCFPDRAPDPASVRACARELLERGSGAVAPGEPPTEEDVVRVAEAMRHGATAVVRGHMVASAHDPEMFAQEMRIGAVGMMFLADQTTRLARGAMAEPRLKQFRAALLDTVQLGRALGVEVAHLANTTLLEQLEPLAGDPSIGPAAARAAATVRAAPDVLFVPDDLEAMLDALARAPPAAQRTTRGLRELVRIAPNIQAEIVRLNRLARAADALQQSRTERALVLSSRFAPITGSQLGNFGAVLDRPFREYDYDAGVYDASHAIAVALCEQEAVAGAPRPARDVGSSTELDLRAPETQRCLGAALETVLRELEVDRSSTAGRVFRMLARAELEATLGADGADRLRADASWGWLDVATTAPPDDAAVTVGEILLSSRVACGPDMPSSCIRELSFDEFLSALRARDYRPHDASMRALLDDADTWTRRTLRKLLDRSYERELARPPSPDLAPAVLLAHRVGEMWLRGTPTLDRFPRLVLDGSTIPAGERAASFEARRVLAHLVPYRLDLDVARGGVSASWLDPALWLGPRASIVGELTPLSYEAARGRVSSSLALLPTLHLPLISIGAGPKGSVRWADGSTTLGASLRASVFQRRLSVAIGTDSFSAGDSRFFLTVGVSDLNGAFFWLFGG